MKPPASPSSSAVAIQAELPADAVEVARIGAAWGVRGWFHVQPFSAEADAIFTSKQWFLLPPARGARLFEGCQAVHIAQCRAHGDGVVARAQGMDSREQAEHLKGARVFVSRAAFPALADGEFYWVDLIGCAVWNQHNTQLGIVRDLLATGPQTTLVIVDEATQQQRLIPFVEAFVGQVDVQARRIEVDWLPEYDD